MEILRGKINTVTHELPAPGATVASATWSFNGVAGGSIAPTNNMDAGTFTLTLPYVQFDGTLVVEATLSIPGAGVVVEKYYYDVITPLLTDQEIFTILDDSDEEYVLADARGFESSVRHIIQAHTGQSFGKALRTVSIQGNGTSVFRLPERLIEATSINGADLGAGWFTVEGGGWFLQMQSVYGVPPIKADYYGINEVTTVTSPVPISAPPYYPRNSRIQVTGYWGWESPPSAVKEAARLLVNDYATDSVYRDKYLTSMTAADWRIQFHSGAFARTGNVRADQLLAPYVLMRGWGVI